MSRGVGRVGDEDVHNGCRVLMGVRSLVRSVGDTLGGSMSGAVLLVQRSLFTKLITASEYPMQLQ